MGQHEGSPARKLWLTHHTRLLLKICQSSVRIFELPQRPLCPGPTEGCDRGYTEFPRIKFSGSSVSRENVLAATW
jgi:hypothetical protein